MRVVGEEYGLDKLEGFSIYLSLPMGCGPWEGVIRKALEEVDGILVIPRQSVANQSAMNADVREKIEWALEMQTLCSVRAFVLARDTGVQLLELGAAAPHYSVTTYVYVTPDFRFPNYVDIFCWRFGVTRKNTLGGFVESLVHEGEVCLL